MILVLTILARAVAATEPPGAMSADDPDPREEPAPVPDPATTPPPEAPPARPRAAGAPTAPPRLTATARAAEPRAGAATGRTVELRDLHAFYGETHAVKGVDLVYRANQVTAMIGPSGCGKSTLVRCINRMHEEIPGARAEGSVTLDDIDIYGASIDPSRCAASIGMVFQKPNPFPTMSIFDNVAAGLRLSGRRGVDLKDRVEWALRGAGLWDEVKDRLGEPGVGLSGGQQQRLCIARTIAVEPEVILMDEPCSALDPIATLKIEELDRRAQGALHDRDRHAQHAAGRARGRHDRVHARRRARRARADGEDLHRTRTTPGPRSTSPGSSAERMPRARHAPALPRRARALEERRARRPRHRASSSSTASLEALEHQDVELAEIVIADDDRVDGRYLEVHQGILSLLALQAPVAGDLRLVAALLHVIKHVERMGDQCVNIAKLIPLSGHEPPVQRGGARHARCGWAAARARRSSRPSAAFADARRRRSPRTSSRQDREINRLNREVFRLAIEIGDDADTREWAMHMMLVARALERIGDNAVDIGEQIAFVVTRAVPRVLGRPRPRHAGRLSRHPSSRSASRADRPRPNSL